MRVRKPKVVKSHRFGGAVRIPDAVVVRGKDGLVKQIDRGYTVHQSTVKIIKEREHGYKV
jgi:hypothetical protein